MDLKSALVKFKDKSFFQQNFVICFFAENYPLLFVNGVFNFLHQKKIIDQKPQFVDLQEINLQSILYQNFLGQSHVYWLGNFFQALNKKKIDESATHLKNYEGPNLIFLFCDDIQFLNFKNKDSVIEVGDEVDFGIFSNLLQFFEKDYSPTKLNYVQNIFKKLKTISFDEAFQFLNYLDLINVSSFAEFEENIHLYFDPEKSLFSLADYFFARNKNFFPLWESVSADYPEMFWVSYFSEQIWKAYFTTMFLQQNKYPEAKKVSFRLPFAYSTKYWKDYSLNELANMSQFLYEIDFALKTGSSFCSLDLFISKHFLKYF